jgi:hypothetical protein
MNLHIEKKLLLEIDTSLTWVLDMLRIIEDVALRAGQYSATVSASKRRAELAKLRDQLREAICEAETDDKKENIHEY